jgi:hypothetical protein
MRKAHGQDWSPAIKIGGLSAAATPWQPACRFGIGLSPKGAIHHSPGQRPGRREESAECLRPEGARQLKPMPQSLSKLYVHLVFSTKGREPLLLRPLRERVHAYLATVLKNLDS